MRDLMEMSYEAKQKAIGGREHHEIFSEMLLEELGKLKGTDILPYLSVSFDVIKHNYDVHLRFPVRVDEERKMAKETSLEHYATHELFEELKSRKGVELVWTDSEHPTVTVNENSPTPVLIITD